MFVPVRIAQFFQTPVTTGWMSVNKMAQEDVQ
jgi:hypothetical protein